MTLIIAECGVNHNGDEATAYKLIDAAVEAGADVAKFQLFKPEGAREQYARLCLPLEAYPRLDVYCKKMGIKFACTAFDAESLRWLLANTEMAFVKISSGEHENEELLMAADRSGLPVIQSTRKGTSTWGRKSHLFVVSEYPTPPEHADLKYFKDMVYALQGRDDLDDVGLSDHSGDIFMPLAAVALGAKIIESHITLDKNQDGPDHTSSLTPEQFNEMVRGIRIIERGL